MASRRTWSGADELVPIDASPGEMSRRAMLAAAVSPPGSPGEPIVVRCQRTSKRAGRALGQRRLAGDWWPALLQGIGRGFSDCPVVRSGRRRAVAAKGWPGPRNQTSRASPSSACSCRRRRSSGTSPSFRLVLRSSGRPIQSEAAARWAPGHSSRCPEFEWASGQSLRGLGLRGGVGRSVWRWSRCFGLGHGGSDAAGSEDEGGDHGQADQDVAAPRWVESVLVSMGVLLVFPRGPPRDGDAPRLR